VLLIIVIPGPVKPEALAEDLPKFANVQEESGIYSAAPLGQAAVWGDYNGDGWQDILLSGLSMGRGARFRNNRRTGPGAADGKGESNRDLLLFRSGEGKSFKESSGEAGLPNITAKAASWGDYDNDGYIDLAVVTIMGGKPPILFKNSKGVTFMDVSEKAGLTIEGPNPKQVLWVDYDNDGLLDLFQAGTGGSLLYRNEGDGSFKEVSGPAGLVPRPGRMELFGSIPIMTVARTSFWQTQVPIFFIRITKTALLRTTRKNRDCRERLRGELPRHAPGIITVTDISTSTLRIWDAR